MTPAPWLGQSRDLAVLACLSVWQVMVVDCVNTIEYLALIDDNYTHLTRSYPDTHTTHSHPHHTYTVGDPFEESPANETEDDIGEKWNPSCK